MHKSWLPVLSMVVGSTAAFAQSGSGLRLQPDELPWPRWQARAGLTTGPDAPQLHGVHLFGDYYFSGPATLGHSRVAGAFRATSGLLLGARGGRLAAPALAQPGLGLSVSRLALPAVGPTFEGAEPAQSLPYIGLGYTGLSLKGGWSFTADVGLMATQPGPGLRLGRALSGGQSLDDLLREMRLRPVLQLGVSYSF